MADEELEGGITNAGLVLRDGDQVIRPAGPNAASVHDLLTEVRRTGFTGLPASFGIDSDGRHRLEFIDGDVPAAPYPEWAQTDDALVSVARLLRQFHDAAGDFDPAPYKWNATLADPRGGTILCHNDVELSNVVFRDGVAVALIDLEFAAPGRPVYDLAHLLVSACRSITTSINTGLDGSTPIDQLGCVSSPTPTASPALGAESW